MKTISLPESILPGTEKFIQDNSISVRVQPENADLTVIESAQQRSESSLEILYSDGWVSCQTARDIANKLEIPLDKMGRLLDHLNVKVKQCGLGCF